MEQNQEMASEEFIRLSKIFYNLVTVLCEKYMEIIVCHRNKGMCRDSSKNFYRDSIKEEILWNWTELN